jgi:predicted peptidase
MATVNCFPYFLFRVRLIIALFLSGIVLVGCTSSKPVATRIMEYKVHSMKIPRNHPDEIHYLVHLPDGYNEDTNKVWPMVFYLHGIGESGNNLNKVLRFGPPHLIKQGKKLPCILVSPQIPKNYFAFRESNTMLEILEEVTARYRVDKRRVHVTGNSMGAFGAILLAAREPERFASLTPMCGGVDFVDALRLRDVPIWAFHGEKDPIIPVDESRRLVNLVRKIGGTAQLTTYSDLGHNCWDRAYDNPELWKWIFEQKKK